MKVILSLTTTFQRQEMFSYTIQSLFNQTYKPDIIIINLSHTPYLADSGFPSAPAFLCNTSIQNTTINWVENTGPYRKLLPSIKYADDEDIIITVDDDIIYSKFFLEKLLNIHYRNNSANMILSSRARFIKKNILGRWKNYLDWNIIRDNTTGMRLLPVGVGGVLYKKKYLDLDFLFDKKYKDIAPYHDDLWIRMASLRKKTPVSVYPDIFKDNLYITHAYGLEQKNLQSLNESHIHEVLFKAKNYMGINVTPNDYAWDAICNYADFNEFSF